MRRKPVARRLAAIADLRAVLRTGGATIAGRLADRPAAPLDEALVYRLLLDHLEAELIAVDLDLTAAEDRYARDRARATALRREHADARSSLYRRQHRIPPILSHLPNGQRELEQAAIAAATPQGAAQLRRQVERTLRLLRDLDPAVVEQVPYLRIDPTAVARGLETGVRRLEAAYAALSDARILAGLSRSDADQAMAHAGRIVPWVARVLEYLCHLAGEHHLAERVRKLAYR